MSHRLSSTGSRPPFVWAHFLGLIVLAVALKTASDLVPAPAGAAVDALHSLPGYLYGLLPPIAAISVGMVALRPVTFRWALGLALATTALMVALDLITSMPSQSQEFGQGAAQRLMRNGRVGVQGVAIDFADVPASVVFKRLLSQELPGWRATAPTYAADAPRLLAVLAAIKLGYLSLPLVLVGAALGIQAWLDDHVVFRRTIDARVAHIILAWVFVPAGVGLLINWLEGVRFRVLFGGAHLLSLAVPYLPFAVVGVIGWIKVARTLRWRSEFTD